MAPTLRHRDFIDYVMLRRWLENPWATVRMRKAPPDTPEHILRLRDGGRIPLLPGSFDYGVFREVFLKDDYRLRALRGQRLGCVIDLGANIGIFAARIAPQADRVLAFEPIPATYRRLERSMEAYPHVEAFCQAVAGRAGNLRLYRPVDERHTVLHTVRQRYEYSGHDDVPAVTLDDVFGEHGVERCDLLKMDVEGAEFDILYATSADTLGRIERIHGEYHDCGPEDPRKRIEHLAAFLEEAGFTVEVAPMRRHPTFGMFFATRV